MFQKGYSPWNKGLKGYTNAGSFKKGISLGYGFKEGNIPWNTGLNYSGMTGKSQSEKQKQIVSAIHKGKTLSKKHKHKLSEFAKTRIGSKANNWQGGISFLPYPAEFNRQLKELIRNRDNYKCRLCGVPQRECLQPLCVHHVDYDKNNCLPLNLISLCHKCNGVVNWGREYWQDYFEDLIIEGGTNEC